MRRNSIVKCLLHEELLSNLKKLAEEAKARFLNMNAFPTSVWEDQSWLYQGKDRIYLLDDGVLCPELELLNKVFLVTYLWDSRARNKPLGSQRLKNLAAAAKVLFKVNVSRLDEINQDAYDQAIQYIKDVYAVGDGLCNNLNAFIRFLKEKSLLNQDVKTVRGATHFHRADTYGRVAIEEKLPLPDLVRAIVQLKWAIDDRWDGSVRCQIDLLAVLTQAFQYGLGLRIGEVLRLPKDCLVEMNGQLFCKVWTEKGSEPVARYVPKIWRSVLQEAVSRINSICEAGRTQAELIENGTFALSLDARFQKRVEIIQQELRATLDKLSTLSEVNADFAKELLTLQVPLADDELIELKRLKEYLPLPSSASGIDSLVKYYKNYGLTVISRATGSFKHKHFVCGRDVKQRMFELVEFRRNLITYNELFDVIHGRAPKAKTSDSSYIGGLCQSKKLTAIEWYVVSGQKAKSGTGCLYLSLADAVKAITNITTGGYDYLKFIPLLDAEQLYPELFCQKTMTRIKKGSNGGFFSYLKISNERINFYRKSAVAKSLTYTGGNGYLLEYESIKEAISKNFVAVNTKIQAELIDQIKNEVLAEGIKLSSRSFSINQKVSDYLFVVPSSLGGAYNEYIPCIMSYFAVLYSIKPTDKDLSVRSAFARYGVSVGVDVIDSFQTHKGRHWQTNSLFRAGLAASIVNKWMGRTDTQGDHYDHQTARERASRVGELMLNEQSRFIGELPEKIKSWKESEIPIHQLESHLNLAIQTAHYGPLGFCIRDINLKPCEYHLKCLTGNNGLGCREFVFDLDNRTQRQNIEAERDKAENELARLFEVMNRPDVPAESVEMHIEHQMTIFRNASSILDRSELILTNAQAQGLRDFQPFRREGSKPDDCAFQCGGKE